MAIKNNLSKEKKHTVVGYELSCKENVLVNHLVPSILAVSLYCINFASDVVVAYRHYSEDNPAWASLTIFFLYLPVLGCFLLTVTAWEHWPEFEGCGPKNVKWALLKIVQHILFPLWSMWRFAEKIFWSIEGLRAVDEKSQKECLEKLEEPRTIELYYFLQGYLQATPQALLQLHILMRNVQIMDKDTVDAQVLCIVISLAKMAMVTTLYQHFKSQKIAGRNYPWFKHYKFELDPSIESFSIRKREEVSKKDSNQPEPTTTMLERRRSSDFYEMPTNSFSESVNNNSSTLAETRDKKSKAEEVRETSIVDGPKRVVFRDASLATSADYFNPRRLRKIKGLPEDDVVDRVVGFLWWFCFLISRILTISSFAFFYPSEIVWILSAHFILTVAILLYDVRADEVRRSKAVFFIFLGYVYLFCLIEFKIRFKKTKFIFFGFFALIFLENMSMCLVWWTRNIEDIMNDFWFKFIFYVITITMLLSFASMAAHIFIFKPKEVVVEVVAEERIW